MRSLLVAGALVGALLAGCQSTDTMTDKSMGKAMAERELTVTIDVLPGSTTPIAPVAWALHTGANPFFSADMSHRIDGLEALAEDGDPGKVGSALAAASGVVAHGVAAVPKGAAGAAPAMSGGSYSFMVKVKEGTRLSFATMYVQSNDLGLWTRLAVGMGNGTPPRHRVPRGKCSRSPDGHCLILSSAF